MEMKIKKDFIMETYLDSIYYSDSTENSVGFIINNFCPSDFLMKDGVDIVSKCADGGYCETCFMVAAVKKINQNKKELEEFYS